MLKPIENVQLDSAGIFQGLYFSKQWNCSFRKNWIDIIKVGDTIEHVPVYKKAMWF